jgi:hypothetical protein
MKQTAVEWLLTQIENKNGKEFSSYYTEFIEQAKAMEKEQIENAYEIGFADAWDDARYDDEPKYATAEQYYKETYESKTKL